MTILQKQGILASSCHYPAFDLALLLCNGYDVPLQIAVKSFLVLHPALVAQLVWGIDYLTPAPALTALPLITGCGVTLGRLHQAM